MLSKVLLALCITSMVQLVVPQIIDPNSVDDKTKAQWCVDQKSSCPLICLQTPGASNKPIQNTCDSSSLAYSCVCSNGQTPNASEFSQTIPFYECQTAANQCVQNCASSDSACQTSCRTAHPCGAQNPTRVNVTSTSTSATASETKAGATSSGGSDSKTTAKNTFTGFGGAAATATGSSSSTGGAQALAVGFGRTYGLATVLLSVAAGCAFML